MLWTHRFSTLLLYQIRIGIYKVRLIMKVDYSKFERDESLYGEVTVKDFDGSEITINQFVL